MTDTAGDRARIASAFAGKYRIVQLLRTGGISQVYLAELLTLRPAPLAPPPLLGADAARAGRAARIAIKVLQPELAGDRAVVRRFERGVAAVTRIVHPNVVRTGGLSRLADGLPYCTMELLIGLDLADTLAAAGRLDVERAVRVALGAAAGLSAAHAAGVVHLDVKPENIFLVHEPDGSEHVKILDFGLAALPGDAADARVDAACSTPEYMAPEQRRGVPPSPSMDVFALGVVLREMLTGSVAADPPGAPPPGAPEVPPRLAAVIARALARDPADRFPTMDALRRALLESAPAQASVAPSTSAPPSPRGAPR
jgi:serine/threonine-protein kinase